MGIVFARDAVVQHGPRIGFGPYIGAVTSQGPKSHQAGFSALTFTLEYAISVRLHARWGLSASVGGWLGAQTGFESGDAAIEYYVTAGPYFDL